MKTRASFLRSSKIGLLSNYATKAIVASMGILMVPIYLGYLGIEVYGLFGFFASLNAAIALLDMGFSQTITREVSKVMEGDERKRHLSELIKSYEVLYWASGILIGALLISLSPLIVKYWIVVDGSFSGNIYTLLIIIAVTIVIQWPSAVYGATLTGLQEQTIINGLRLFLVILQNIGAILVLKFIGASIENLFKWQFITAILNTLILSYITKSQVDFKKYQPKVNWKIIKNNFRYSSGISGISITTFFLTQTDKIILSGLLSLNMYGYYILASNMVNALNNLVSPISEVFFPKFVKSIAAGNFDELKKLFHLSSQIIALIVFPVFLTVAIFSKELLGLWLNNPEAAVNSSPILSMLIVGSMINSLIALPYLIRLAEGNPRIIVVSNVIAIALLIPLTWVLAKKYDGIGAATVWVILNTGYLVFLLPYLFRNTLRGEFLAWGSHEVALPILVNVLILGSFYAFMPDSLRGLWLVCYIGIGYLSASGISFWYLKLLRTKTIIEIKKMYSN